MTDKELEQLNVKIARKLGWRKFRLERTPEPMKTQRMTGISSGNFRHQFVPAYTNNLSYALQIVDWANRHGYDFTLGKCAAGGAVYIAHFNKQFIPKRYTGRGTLPSMAICMAFLNIK